MKKTAIATYNKAELQQSLEEGLQPIIDNIDVEKLSNQDKVEIRASLDKLQELALKIKSDIGKD